MFYHVLSRSDCLAQVIHSCIFRKSRQYRLEEREKDGTVKGQYGYYDAKGKLRTIKYTARPMEGYQEKHHEVNLSDLS